MQIISDKNSVPNNIDLHKMVTEHLVLGPAFYSRLQIQKEGGLPRTSWPGTWGGLPASSVGRLREPTSSEDTPAGAARGVWAEALWAARASAHRCLWLLGYFGNRPTAFSKGQRMCECG